MEVAKIIYPDYKNSKGGIIMRKFLSGIVVGVIIVSGCLAVDSVITKTSHPIYVNGNQVAFDAYNIDGYNYFKLKDLGKALDFNVLWNESEQKVLIDTTKPYEEQGITEEQEVNETKEKIIKIPQSAESFCPPVGTVIEAERFADGKFTGEKTTFTITTAKPAEPELPQPTCDWTQFPELEFPEAVVKDFGNGRTSILNLHETKRMQLELYNLIGSNPATWENGTIAKYKGGTDKVKVSFEILGEPQMMWPYRASEIKKVFDSCPCRTWRVIAYDSYKDGRFLHTVYYLE